MRETTSAGWLLRGLKLWVSLWWRGLRARAALAQSGRPELGAFDLAFVTYFPYRDRYFGPLRRALSDEGKRAAWLLHFVGLEGAGYGAALAEAGALARGGEAVYFLEEFLLPRDAARGFFLWLRAVRRARRALRAAGPLLVAPDVGGPAAREATEGLWRRSFYGPPLVEGIAYSLIFERALSSLGGRGDLVYLAERHAWEKALEAAKRRARPGWRTIAYQHSALLGNWFNYEHHPEEAEAGLPLPDVLAANGALPAETLGARYPKTTRVEALRYLPLAEALARPVPSPLPRVLLVAGSIDPVEAAGLAGLVAAAFPKADGLRILFKGHPMTPFGPILAARGVDLEARGYELIEGTSASALESAGVVLTAASGIALEALAYGREVVVPSLPGVLPMSPLLASPDDARWAKSAEELRALVLQALENPRPPSEKRALVGRYWDLDESLPGWRGLLGLGSK